MAWSNSKIFTATITDLMNNTTAIDLNTDASIKAALYNNTTAPDQTVASANTAYAVGQWVVGNEVSDTTEWAAGGVALTSVTSGFTTNVYSFDAANTASGASATLAAVFGCLVYDDTIVTPVADQGLCYNYFGGTQSVTDGTFTIIWGTAIFQLTL